MTDVTSRLAGAATLLRDAAIDGELLAELPDDARPRSRTEAYDVQAAGAELTGQPTVGWKIAATSPAGQAHINVPGPLAGRILAERVYTDGDTVALTGNAMCLAEVEFVFVTDTDLPPRVAPYTIDEVAAAVADLRFGIELPSTRFLDTTTVGDVQLIADNACAHDFLLGPVAPDSWHESDLSAVEVTADIVGPSGARRVDGIGRAVLGHPLAALTWLVNELSAHGVTLEAGQLVTTGTCCTPIPVAPGDRLTAHFAGLGTVTCSFGDDDPRKGST